MDIKKFTAEQILLIPLDKPEKLYIAKDEDELKLIYRKLSMKWHPDRHIQDNKDTSPVFAHLKVLYEQALKKINNGLWHSNNTLMLTSIDGKKYSMKYYTEEKFELGKRYIGSSFCAWVFDKENEDLARKAIKNIENFNFANDKMKDGIKRHLPTIKKSFQTKDKTIIVIDKDPGLLCLEDVLNFHKGKIDPKHVAWILSGLYNLACYLEYSKKMHGGISLDNYFINPATHDGALLGGWWFSHSQNDSLIALSQKAIDIAPMNIMTSKKANTSLNLEMIRQVGRKLLGDESGVYLPRDKEIPKALVNWLRDASSKNAFEEYDLWQKKVLKDSFGIRRFTEMKLTTNDIYL